jgi:hypothetical protein
MGTKQARPETLALPPIPSRLKVTDEFGYWFSGFFDGEGCFLFKDTREGKTTFKPKIKVAVRFDDRAVIDSIHKQMGCGVVYSNRYHKEKYKTTKPWVEFRVHRIGDLAEVIVPLFERYPLHTKKAQEFKYWKGLVQIRYHSHGARVSAQEQQFFDILIPWLDLFREGGEPPPSAKT